jgi:hypothetical protein
MEPDRFDDVASRIVEGPEPPRRRSRRPRRWALVVAASVLTAGALAAGASALTGSGDDRRAPAARKAPAKVSHTADGVPYVRSGPECRAGEGRRHAKRGSATSALKH